MTITYIAGNLNCVVDDLSRKREVGNIEETDIKILYEDDLDMNAVVVMEGISDVELRKDQLADVKVRDIIEGIARGEERRYYRIRNEVLYKGRMDTEDVLMLLCNRVEEVLIGMNDNIGHQWIDRNVARVNLKYTWYGRHKDIRKYINNCKIGQVCKNVGRRPRMEMGQLIATKLLELVFLDIVTLDKSSDGRDSVLVITDAYTKCTKAVPTRNQLIVAKVLMN